MCLPLSPIPCRFKSACDAAAACDRNGACDVIPGYLLGIAPCQPRDLPDPFAASEAPYAPVDTPGPTRRRTRTRSRTPGVTATPRQRSQSLPGAEDEAERIYKKAPPKRAAGNPCTRLIQYLFSLW